MDDSQRKERVGWGWKEGEREGKLWEMKRKEKCCLPAHPFPPFCPHYSQCDPISFLLKKDKKKKEKDNYLKVRSRIHYFSVP